MINIMKLLCFVKIAFSVFAFYAWVIERNSFCLAFSIIFLVGGIGQYFSLRGERDFY